MRIYYALLNLLQYILLGGFLCLVEKGYDGWQAIAVYILCIMLMIRIIDELEEEQKLALKYVLIEKQ